MIASMTGYANDSIMIESGSLSIELRAVNHRFLDIQLRLPDTFRRFEPQLRNTISQHVKRGKLECRINFERHYQADSLTLNQSLLQQLAQQQTLIQQQFPQARPATVTELLQWPGVLQEQPVAHEPLEQSLFQLLPQVLQQFNDARQREGSHLCRFLQQRSHEIHQIRARILPLLPECIQDYRHRLTQRLHNALQDIEHDRLQQEIALYASKIDVDEELSRLCSHLDELDRILNQGGPVGKRLDFLMQELNREANTLASKSVHNDISQAAMEMKVLIEQMREQVQNIE